MRSLVGPVLSANNDGHACTFDLASSVMMIMIMMMIIIIIIIIIIEDF